MNILTRLTDMILYPFRNLSPVWGIAFLSLLTTIFILSVYRTVSNQEAIRLYKRRIQGHFLGIYLFRDDAGQILISLGKLLLGVFKYLGHSARPLLVIIIPVLLLCLQMQLHYGYQSLTPGRETMVSLTLAEGSDFPPLRIEMRAPPGILPRTPPLRILPLRETDWKIEVVKAGDYSLSFSVGENEAGMEVKASAGIGRIYPEKRPVSLKSLLNYPGEEPLPENSPISAIRIYYPPRRIALVGFHFHWAVLFFILTVVFGLLLKRPLRVDF